MGALPGAGIINFGTAHHDCHGSSRSHLEAECLRSGIYFPVLQMRKPKLRDRKEASSFRSHQPVRGRALLNSSSQPILQAGASLGAVSCSSDQPSVSAQDHSWHSQAQGGQARREPVSQEAGPFGFALSTPSQQEQGLLRHC